jgi:hypothetical protein
MAKKPTVAAGRKLVSESVRDHNPRLNPEFAAMQIRAKHQIGSIMRHTRGEAQEKAVRDEIARMYSESGGMTMDFVSKVQKFNPYPFLTQKGLLKAKE